MRQILIAGLLGLAFLFLTACGDDNPSGIDHGGDGGSMMSEDMGGGPMSGIGHDGQENTPVVDSAREIEVTASSFAFDPDSITVGAGEDVTIVLTAEDVLHDFTVGDADGHVAADAGDTASGGIRIDEPGTYTFYCSVSGHREAGMEGILVVE